MYVHPSPEERKALAQPQKVKLLKGAKSQGGPGPKNWYKILRNFILFVGYSTTHSSPHFRTVRGTTPPSSGPSPSSCGYRNKQQTSPNHHNIRSTPTQRTGTLYWLSHGPAHSNADDASRGRPRLYCRHGNASVPAPSDGQGGSLCMAATASTCRNGHGSNAKAIRGRKWTAYYISTSSWRYSYIISCRSSSATARDDIPVPFAGRNGSSTEKWPHPPLSP